MACLLQRGLCRKEGHDEGGWDYIVVCLWCIACDGDIGVYAGAYARVCGGGYTGLYAGGYASGYTDGYGRGYAGRYAGGHASGHTQSLCIVLLSCSGYIVALISPLSSDVVDSKLPLGFSI